MDHRKKNYDWKNDYIWYKNESLLKKEVVEEYYKFPHGVAWIKKL